MITDLKPWKKPKIKQGNTKETTWYVVIPCNRKLCHVRLVDNVDSTTQTNTTKKKKRFMSHNHVPSIPIGLRPSGL